VREIDRTLLQSLGSVAKVVGFRRVLVISFGFLFSHVLFELCRRLLTAERLVHQTVFEFFLGNPNPFFPFDPRRFDVGFGLGFGLLLQSSAVGLSKSARVTDWLTSFAFALMTVRTVEDVITVDDC
jgi:hypothetical protein